MGRLAWKPAPPFRILRGPPRSTAKNFPSLILFVHFPTFQVFPRDYYMRGKGGGEKEKEFWKKFRHGEKGQCMAPRYEIKRRPSLESPSEGSSLGWREISPGQMGKLRFEEILNYSQRFETVHPCFTIVREGSRRGRNSFRLQFDQLEVWNGRSGTRY